ncbi:MAG: TolC family protein [Lysobacterales bacterium]
MNTLSTNARPDEPIAHVASTGPVPLLVFAVIAVATFFTLPANAQFSQRVGVAVVTDGPAYQLKDVEKVFVDELLALTDGEFTLDFVNLVADWSVDSVNSAMANAYRNPDVDLVLVLGFAANQLVVSRQQFAKPTFLPLVFSPDLLSAPSQQNRSGRKNLNYLADRVPFGQDLASFQRVAPFSKAVLLSDEVLINAVPQAVSLVRRQAPEVDFTFIGHDGRDHQLLERIPLDTQAVILGGLPRIPFADLARLLEGLTARRLPSFSLVSESEVRRGVLASDTVQTDYVRLARRNALNMQAVMLGETAEDQPIDYEGKRQLTINMETARSIGLSPRFDVLSEAELINAQPPAQGPELTLISVAQLTLQQNLDLEVSELDVRVGEQNVQFARANLLPQVNLGASYTTRRDNPAARAPGAAERSTAGSATLNQLIYSESALSGYSQEKSLQQAREASFASDRLDRVLDTTTTFLQALRATNQVKIQQDNLGLTKTNLELAKDRVQAGSASNADVYRWQARLATARSAVLSAQAAQSQSFDALNRLLNQPIGTPLRLRIPDKGTPFPITTQDFDQLINNPRRFAWFVDFNVNLGLQRSPALAQIDGQLRAVQRDVVARRRAYWAPDVSLQARYNDAINASGIGSGTDFDELNDWSVSLNASWPLFDSGARRSQLARATLQERQLATQREATAQRVEQNVRFAMHNASASYANIELSESGALASRQNLDLVSDAYRQGAVSIIDLLDAQNQSLQADLSANNAVHDFLIDIMNLQRATGIFTFLEPMENQQRFTDNLRQFIQSREAQYQAPGVQP